MDQRESAGDRPPSASDAAREAASSEDGRLPWDQTDAYVLSSGFGDVYDATQGRVAESVLPTYQQSYRSLDPRGRAVFRARIVWNAVRGTGGSSERAAWDAVALLDGWFPAII